MPKLYLLSSASLSFLVLFLTTDTQIAQAQQSALSLLKFESRELVPLEPREEADERRSEYLFVKEKPENLAQAAEQGEKTAALLVQEGKELYESGQFSGAAQVWQQAVQRYERQEALDRALVVSSLSLAYQQLGDWKKAMQASKESLQLIQKTPQTSAGYTQILAQVLNNQGSLQFSLGQSDQALSTWKKAAVTYEAAQDSIGSAWNKFNQAQALQALGFYRLALGELEEAERALQQQPDSEIKVAALRSLGNTLSGVGDHERSRQILQQSLTLAQKLQLPYQIDQALLSLGNTAQAQQDYDTALAFYQQATETEVSLDAKFQAQLNVLALLVRREQLDTAQALVAQILPQISNLPSSRTNIYAQINLAQSLIQLKQIDTTSFTSWQQIAQLIASAVEQAKSIDDRRAEAYALGSLGGLYEQNGQRKEAEQLTYQALLLAESLNAPELSYRLQAQMGRLLKASGDTAGAIAAYSESVNALKSLRSDLVATDPTIQFDFRDEVEPIYRQLVELLLQEDKPSQLNLIRARETIEALQVAELNNFFRTACLENKPVALDRLIDKEDRSAAVIYPILLPERVDTIVKLPGLPLQKYSTKIPQAQAEQVLLDVRQKLTKPYPYTLQQAQRSSQQVYDWLIRPIESQLQQTQVKTVVFVPDSAFRNLPTAALYDGKQYLIEKYAIATSPSLQLSPPRPLERLRLKVLSAGLTKARQGFSPLPNVEVELSSIASEVSKNEILLNQQFTSDALQHEIDRANFPIVHVATHGQFSSQQEKTFILAWNKRIRANEFGNLMRMKDPTSAIELLVLSACQTAAGDRRAALGLAGIAVRAGARSTLASLWSLDDESSAHFMSAFYQGLSDRKLSKAQALRQAQLTMLQNPLYKSPRYWANFVLLGSWL